MPMQAQYDLPVKMKPDFALAIQLTKIPNGVSVKFPVLINLTTVLKPGMILRNIYLPPANDGDSQNLNMAHLGDMTQSFTRDNATMEGKQTMSPQISHELEHERRIVWDIPLHFEAALAQMPTDSIHLIYSASGNNLNLQDANFSFLEGLFVGSPSGGVSVLAVEIGS